MSVALAIRSRVLRHHGSHRQLLARVTPRRNAGARIDAIIVPTARPGKYLRHAVALAARLRCTLVALCSKDASISDARELAQRKRVNVIAVDAAKLPSGLMPTFATSLLLARESFQREQDIALKRNLGLLMAAMTGWRNVLFLDDDILIPRVADVVDAASLLDQHDAVGLSQVGFPDNSVVCHAFRAVGGYQDTFIGGGALVVRTESVESFFPAVYNEDWFFLLDSTQLNRTAAIGSAIQREYDPFANEVRARSEEFGDTLAEGLFWLLDNKRRIKEAHRFFWRTFIDSRRMLIAQIADEVRLGIADAEVREKMLLALEAALERSQLIEPGLCVDFLRAWRGDCRQWRRHVAELRTAERLEPLKAISELGLVDCSEYMLTSKR